MPTTAAPPLPRYRRVVVPLDGSPFAESVVPLAQELCDVFGARIELAGFGLKASDEAALQERLLAVAEEHAGAHVWTGVNWHVADGIGHVVDGLEPALVCMASHARHGVNGAYHGSVAADVLAEWRQPLMLVGPAYEPSRRLTGGPVVVAVDGHPGSHAALEVAAGWADRLDVALEVLTVAEPVPEPPAGHHTHRHHGPGDSPEQYVEALAAQLRSDGRTVAAGVLYDPVSVADALTDYVAARPAGLIVLASRPRPGAVRALFGSTANDIVRDSVVPVLVAPRPPGPDA